jgi:RNA polymerase sigma-70 factor, ECF subfamily
VGSLHLVLDRFSSGEMSFMLDWGDCPTIGSGPTQCLGDSPCLALLRSLSRTMNQPLRQRVLRLIPGGPADGTSADAAIVRAVQAGNAAAAAAFHDRIRPIVDRTLSRLLGVRDPDYDDLAQLALIELVMSVDSFRGDCPLDAWISIVSARVVYRHLRRRRLERRLFVVGTNEPGFERESLPQVSARSLMRLVEEHLAALDRKKAWAFVLHDVHGYDLSEVAEITGSSVAAAQSRLVRGRRELHQRLAGDPELAEWVDRSLPARAAP